MSPLAIFMEYWSIFIATSVDINLLIDSNWDGKYYEYFNRGKKCQSDSTAIQFEVLDAGVWIYYFTIFYHTFFTAFEWTATALPEGSSIFSNSLLHRNATGEEQAIDGPASTVKAASLDGNISSKISR